MLKTTYDYEAASSQDEIVGIVANVINIVIPAIRPDISIILDTFPFCELIHIFCSSLMTRYIR